MIFSDDVAKDRDLIVSRKVDDEYSPVNGTRNLIWTMKSEIDACVIAVVLSFVQLCIIDHSSRGKACLIYGSHVSSETATGNRESSGTLDCHLAH